MSMKIEFNKDGAKFSHQSQRFFVTARMTEYMAGQMEDWRSPNKRKLVIQKL